jgi:hypothetical protein
LNHRNKKGGQNGANKLDPKGEKIKRTLTKLRLGLGTTNKVENRGEEHVE